MPISSSATLILRPFGVFQVWSSMVIGIRLFCSPARAKRADQDYRDRAGLQEPKGEGSYFTVERNRNKPRSLGSRGSAAPVRTEHSAAWLRPSHFPCHQ